jgi:hypothetical protein
MVRLLVEEACDALPPPDDAQCGRGSRFVAPTSPSAPIPRSGFVLRPITVIARSHFDQQLLDKPLSGGGSWREAD